MYFIYHTCYSTMVTRKDQELQSQCVYLSTDTEAIGTLRVEVSSYRIKEARWEVCRSPGDALNGIFEVPDLKGSEAYSNAGAILREKVGDQGQGLARELISECVRGLLQSETYVYKERGYASAKEYDDHWEQNDTISCRYYSNIDRIVQHWREYIGDYARNDSLYNKIKTCTLMRHPDDSIMSNASFIDSYHELIVSMETDADGTVNKCSGNYLRAPDQICFECADLLKLLLGKNLADLKKKALAQDLGGSIGCNHLVDLVFDISRAIADAVKR